jgi:hypothetical protein
MNADEKALSIIEKWDERIFYGGKIQKMAVLQSAIVQALKEQDRETRHKCAEAVIQLPKCFTANDNAIYNNRDEICRAVDSNAAHDACMNAKAV